MENKEGNQEKGESDVKKTEGKGERMGRAKRVGVEDKRGTGNEDKRTGQKEGRREKWKQIEELRMGDEGKGGKDCDKGQ